MTILFSLSPLFFQTKKGEIDATVLSVVNDVGMVFERMVFAMFKDEDAFGLQQLPIEDEVGQRREFLQRIGRVGKDDVKLLFTLLDIAKDVGKERVCGLGIELLKTFFDESEMAAVVFHAYHFGTSA